MDTMGGEIVDYLHQADFSAVVQIAFLGNFLLFFLSIIFYAVAHYLYNSKQELVERHPILKADIGNAILNISLNAVVAIAGIYMLRIGWIKIVDLDWKVFPIKFLGVLFLVDFLMFILHWLVHKSILYRYFHYRHHTFERTNALSLFVMHPLENVMFGAILIITFMLIPCDIFTVGFYLGFNLLWGILGHIGFNLLEFKNRWITNGLFHMNHHHDIHVNFGFYTSIWDRLFKTHRES